MDTPEDPGQQPAAAGETDSAEAPKMWMALLDADGTLTGFDETGKAEGVKVEPGCDLAPGKYAWDGKTFVPLLHRFRQDQIVNPDAMTAIALGFGAIRDGKPLGPYTLAWLMAFEKQKGKK